MGNSIAKNYIAPKDFTCTAGHNSLWKIWPARHKDSGMEASLWVFDKAELSKQKGVEKAVVEQILHVMKKDMQLMKDMSSTGGYILQVLEVIEDLKGGIVFVTERIVCSLADYMSNFEGIPGGVSYHRNHFDDIGNLSELEISRGMSNITEALQCLHNVHRKLHLNVSPENIVITSSGQWKLCGFGFSLGFGSNENTIASPYFMKQLNIPSNIRLEPDLRYCAPELTVDGFSSNKIRYASSKSDIFSFGVVCYELFRDMNNLLNSLEGSNKYRKGHNPIIAVSNNSVMHHPAALEGIQHLDYSFLPNSLAQLLQGMIQMVSSSRISISDIINSSYFSSGPLATLKSLDTLLSRDLAGQSSLLAILPSQLSTFPARILENSVLLPVCRACQANPSLWTFGIPIHMFVVERIPRAKYCNIAGPFVRHAYAEIKIPEIMQVLLRNIRFFIDCFSDDNDSQSHSSKRGRQSSLESAYVAMLASAIEKQQHPIQIFALQILCDSNVRNYISQSRLIEEILPKIGKEACKNPDSNVKIHALYVLSLISMRLDREYLIMNILPSLKYIMEHDQNPAVAMAVLGNYEAIADILGNDYIAIAVLPSIVPLLIDRSLDNRQMETVIQIVVLLMKRVIDTRMVDLPSCQVEISFRHDGNSLFDPFHSVKSMIKENAKYANDNNRLSDSYSTSIEPIPFTGSRSMESTTTTGQIGKTDLALSSPTSVNNNNGMNGGTNSSLSSAGFTIVEPKENASIQRIRKPSEKKLSKDGKSSPRADTSSNNADFSFSMASSSSSSSSLSSSSVGIFSSYINPVPLGSTTTTTTTAFVGSIPSFPSFPSSFPMSSSSTGSLYSGVNYSSSGPLTSSGARISSAFDAMGEDIAMSSSSSDSFSTSIPPATSSPMENLSYLSLTSNGYSSGYNNNNNNNSNGYNNNNGFGNGTGTGTGTGYVNEFGAFNNMNCNSSAPPINPFLTGATMMASNLNSNSLAYSGVNSGSVGYPHNAIINANNNNSNINGSNYSSNNNNNNNGNGSIYNYNNSNRNSMNSTGYIPPSY